MNFAIAKIQHKDILQDSTFKRIDGSLEMDNNEDPEDYLKRKLIPFSETINHIANREMENVLEKDLDGVTFINNYKFYSTILEYQKPDIDYLEQTEKIQELPQDLGPYSKLFEYDFKIESQIKRRKKFLENIYGNFFISL